MPLDEHLQVRDYVPPNAEWFGLLLPDQLIEVVSEAGSALLSPWDKAPSSQHPGQRYGSLKMREARRLILKATCAGRWLARAENAPSVRNGLFEAVGAGEYAYGLMVRLPNLCVASRFRAQFAHGGCRTWNEVTYRPPVRPADR